MARSRTSFCIRFTARTPQQQSRKVSMNNDPSGIDRARATATTMVAAKTVI
jgi:hypothetical protein